MHSTQSRQMNYYAKNKDEILAEKREKHLLQKLKNFRPLQIPKKSLCFCKKSHKYSAFEITFNVHCCFQCIGYGLPVVPDWQDFIRSITLPVFKSGRGCVGCGRAPCYVTHAHVEAFMWKKEG